MITITEQLECVEREIRMRRRAYPRWVEAGKMTQAKANAELHAMEAVAQTLRRLAEGERLL